jgi:hypothetical protein
LAARLIVYGVLAAAALGWAAALPLAALAAGGPAGGAAGDAFAVAVYGLGSALCHQRPERSFDLLGTQWPVCGRCAGLYAGGAAAALAALLPGARVRMARLAAGPRRLLAAGAAPTALTLAYEWLGGLPSNLTRAAAGVALGAAAAIVLLVFSVEPLGPRTNQVN